MKEINKTISVTDVKLGEYIKFRKDFTKEELKEILAYYSGWANIMEKNINIGYIKVEEIAGKSFVLDDIFYTELVFEKVITKDQHPEYFL